MNRTSTLAGALLASMAMLPVAAAAQPLQGLYIGLGTGANLAADLLSSHETTKIYNTVGPVGLADLGWGFGNGLRTEIEGSYRSTDIGGISTRRSNGVLEPLGGAGGNDGIYAVMANIAYDIPVQPFGLQPYVGAGVGYGWLDLGGAHGNGFSPILAPGNTIVASPNRVSFGTVGAFAYQAMAGASMPLSVLPGLSATLEYRYFGMARTDVPVNRVITNGNTVNGGLLSSSTHNGFFPRDHAILIGLRYSFGTSATPAPAIAAPTIAAPAPAPARSYIVFFDWDKVTLTGRARQIVADAAASSVKTAGTRIETNGYTDTSGSEQYNRTLSIRRAEAVAEELVNDGVPKSAIAIQGFGETHLLVPTASGVREPQNRRVEIVIR